MQIILKKYSVKHFITSHQQSQSNSQVNIFIVFFSVSTYNRLDMRQKEENGIAFVGGDRYHYQRHTHTLNKWTIKAWTLSFIINNIISLNCLISHLTVITFSSKLCIVSIFIETIPLHQVGASSPSSSSYKKTYIKRSQSHHFRIQTICPSVCIFKYFKMNHFKF